MANEKELNPSPKFPVGEKPELSPNPNFSDGLENKTNERANTQIVNESKPQPIKNLTIQQIIELIQKYAPGFDPSSVEAGTLVNALGLNSDGLLKKQALAGMFDGKYVRIMDAPSSTTLNDEQIAQIKKGVFINGNFIGYVNPVLMPAAKYGNTSRGIIISTKNVEHPQIGAYSINEDTKKISAESEYYGVFNLACVRGINGKNIPAYPANTGTFTLKCVNGALTWVAD